MGLKVPDPPDDYGFGDDCPNCFTAGATPNYVFVRFYGIRSCPGKFPPPNGYLFVLEQDAIDPCFWQGVLKLPTGEWLCSYDADVPWGLERRAELAVSHINPNEVAVFFGRAAGCAIALDNLQLNCTMGSGFNGSAMVTVFIDPIIIALTSCYHFATIPGVLHEKMDVGIDHAVYKLNHRSDKTNVLIYLDKEELELPW